MWGNVGTSPSILYTLKTPVFGRKFQFLGFTWRKWLRACSLPSGQCQWHRHSACGSGTHQIPSWRLLELTPYLPEGKMGKRGALWAPWLSAGRGWGSPSWLSPSIFPTMIGFPSQSTQGVLSERGSRMACLPNALGMADLWAGLVSFGMETQNLIGDSEFSNNSLMMFLALVFKRREGM